MAHEGEHEAMPYTQRAAVLVAAKLLGLYFLYALFAFPVLAQAAAEATAATSASSAVAISPKQSVIPNTLPTNVASGTPHLPSYLALASQEINRRDLEAKAGKNAGKLLIRSIPGEAQVWIDGQPIGTTPLLLIVAPGKYGIELRGQRAETARTEVALLPKETREVAIRLQLRYPTRVILH